MTGQDGAGQDVLQRVAAAKVLAFVGEHGREFGVRQRTQQPGGDHAELAGNVSIAMLIVLETLGPAERAVFVLREVFQTLYHEIEFLDRVQGRPPFRDGLASRERLETSDQGQGR